jgi:OOP family OmpA-OmpF porin
MHALRLLLIAVAVSLLSAQAASAQGFYVGVHGGLGLGLEGLDQDGGYAVNGVIGYKFTPSLRAEGEIAYRENEWDDCFLFCSRDEEGTISSLAFMANVFYDFNAGSAFRPYLGGGLGVANVELDVEDSSESGDDTVFAFQFALGVAYEMTQSTALVLDLRYFRTEEPELVGRLEPDYDNVSLMAGLRYSF